jgi:hypothetical protein
MRGEKKKTKTKRLLRLRAPETSDDPLLPALASVLSEVIAEATSLIGLVPPLPQGKITERLVGIRIGRISAGLRFAPAGTKRERNRPWVFVKCLSACFDQDEAAMLVGRIGSDGDEKRLNGALALEEAALENDPIRKRLRLLLDELAAKLDEIDVSSVLDAPNSEGSRAEREISIDGNFARISGPAGTAVFLTNTRPGEQAPSFGLKRTNAELDSFANATPLVILDGKHRALEVALAEELGALHDALPIGSFVLDEIRDPDSTLTAHERLAAAAERDKLPPDMPPTPLLLELFGKNVPKRSDEAKLVLFRDRFRSRIVIEACEKNVVVGMNGTKSKETILVSDEPMIVLRRKTPAKIIS